MAYRYVVRKMMSYYIVKWSYKRGYPLKTGFTVLVVMCIKKRIYQYELALKGKYNLTVKL